MVSKIPQSASRVALAACSRGAFLSSADDPNRGGYFTDATDALLPLFADPDGRGSRRWREMFGLERPLARRQRGAFIAREALRSSSGSR